jgi:peptide/nickel transport system permease protein
MENKPDGLHNPSDRSHIVPAAAGGVTAPVALDLEVVRPAPTPGAPAPVRRSPGQLVWARLRRDRVAIASAAVLGVFALVAIFADLIAAVYGHDKDAVFPQLLDDFGFPLGRGGGISAEHWFGVEPGVGRDVFIQLVYGARTSLGIAVLGAGLATALGVVIGIVAGYLGGRVDTVMNWFIDLFLAFPFIIFALAAVPIANTMITGSPQLSPGVLPRIVTLVVVLVAFGWMGTARLVRGQVLSLRERQYVDAARVSGAGLRHIMFRELLPNLWGPILVTFSMAVPAYIQAEAALSFLNIGVTEPVPDWGRMIFYSIPYARSDWTFTFFPGAALFLVVLAANLLGDSLRDALDPRASR